MDFSADKVLSRMKAALKNDDTKIEGSFTMDNLQAVSEEIARLDAMRLVPLQGMLADRESDMGTSGNEKHYERWAKEVKNILGEPIVGNAKVDAPRDGTGNVFIAIISKAAGTPTKEDIQAVQSYINSKRPIGANPIVSAATGIAIKIICNAVVKEGFSSETVRGKVENGIKEYLLSTAFFSGALALNYYTLGNIVSSTEGVKEISVLTVNGKQETVTGEYNKYFELKELSVNVS